MSKLAQLKSLVKVYGAKLYEQGAVILNTADEKDVKLSIVDGETLCITEENGEQMFFRIAQSTVDAGLSDGQHFDITEFTALRDADGTRENGDAWSVAKGNKKYVAM